MWDAGLISQKYGTIELGPEYLTIGSVVQLMGDSGNDTNWYGTCGQVSYTRAPTCPIRAPFDTYCIRLCKVKVRSLYVYALVASLVDMITIVANMKKLFRTSSYMAASIREKRETLCDSEGT